ncbi:flagellar protein FliS [Sandaracinobacter sp. RS1-74]|uniref:flagellar export chaperone FliS n=1 Tax=Sandaracinobacteroides sayramensis TaxID=2913411 RepID=UPI001EDB1C45|nr:flagellar export chaperone FliS [Sandaracinobacteroides sayramensis]MCG2840756.1 flagellar protein FliS [Sandaracinobacteroides sayramensis]
MLQTLQAARPTPLQRQALAGYGTVSLDAKVATASPHELVRMLYRRLTALLREARDAAEAGDTARRLKATERALAIVEGLDATLDMERGGSVAESLHRVYELLLARLLAGDAASLDEALTSTQAIADAWAGIAPAR